MCECRARRMDMRSSRLLSRQILQDEFQVVSANSGAVATELATAAAAAGDNSALRRRRIMTPEGVLVVAAPKSTLFESSSRSGGSRSKNWKTGLRVTRGGTEEDDKEVGNIDNRELKLHVNGKRDDVTSPVL